MAQKRRALWAVWCTAWAVVLIKGGLLWAQVPAVRVAPAAPEAIDSPFLGIEPGPDHSPITWHYQHPLSVWGINYLAFITRNLGGWTFQELNVPLAQLKPYLENGSDLSYDFFTRTQLMHALLSGDAGPLRQAYGFLQQAGVPLVSLVHDLQNHDEITYQLPELEHRAGEKFTLGGKTQTGAELRQHISKSKTTAG
jgi:hypothetical protein